MLSAYSPRPATRSNYKKQTKMETKKIITLLGKELTISYTYQTTKTRGYAYTETIESIDIDLKDITSLITTEEDAKQLAEEMSEYTYNEAYNACKSQAEEGEALYAYRTLVIFLNGTGKYNSGSISATAMYSELTECSKRAFTYSGYDIDRKDEEDEDGNEIEESVKYNAILDALKREEFIREMSDRELIDFEGFEKEARENYKRLHPEY